MAKGKSLLLGMLVGGTISAAATLLSTPTSGREFRMRVKEHSSEWKQSVDELLQSGLQLKNQIAETSKESVALVSDLTQDMKKSVEEWKVTIEPHQENIHEYLEQIESSLKALEEKIKTD